MNYAVESDAPRRSRPGSGLAELRQSPTFRGPVDPPADHDHSNDHFALVYEDRAEQFAAAVPFVRQGLERGERCLYVADENSTETVVEAMRARGVDVDAALDSGALSVHTPADTYRRDGAFDPDAMLEFWEDALDEATADGEYTGIRACAEMTWALEDETALDDLVEYESLLNPLYSDDAYTVMCQYNRERFPAAVVRDVIRTHPHVIQDGVVSENVYYAPPEKFFGPDDPADDVERMMGTLRERTETKVELGERERFQRRLYEVTADPDRSFDEKLRAVVELGCEQFDLEYGGLARIDPERDLFEVETINREHDHLVSGETYPLSETYCSLATEDGTTVGVTDPVDRGFDGKLCYEQFGVRAYLGTHLAFEDDDDRTLFFLSNEPRDEEFSDAERTFHHLMGQWVRFELERRHQERTLEETVDQLQQSNDRLKQFAYAASHDLQEPLRMVSSYLQLLDNQYGEDLDAEAREYIDFAVDNADRMRTMVSDLLAYSRVEQSDTEFGPVDCDAVLDRVLADLAAEIEATEAEVTAESLPTVVGDGHQLEELFRNLVSNAVKYSGDAAPRVEITAEKRPTHWEIAVADDGIGIEPGKTDRIFEVFKRLHHEDEYPGTGIGLSLCQEIVENHDGSIRVESEPGEGATFYVELPRRSADRYDED